MAVAKWKGIIMTLLDETEIQDFWAIIEKSGCSK